MSFIPFIDPRRKRMLPLTDEEALTPPRLPDFQPVTGAQQIGRNALAAIPQLDMTRQTAPPEMSAALPEAAPSRINLPTSDPVQLDYQQAMEPEIVRTKAQRMVEKGPPRHEDIHKGKLGRLKDILMSGLESGFNPLVMTRVGIDPQLYHDRTYREELEPLLQRAEVEDQTRNAALAKRMKVAEALGYDPVRGSHYPTEMARHRMTVEEQNRINTENLKTNREQMNIDRDLGRERLTREDREQAAKSHVEAARRFRKPVDPATVRGTTMEPFAGAVPPEEALTPYQKESLRLREEGNKRADAATTRAEEAQNRADRKEQQQEISRADTSLQTAQQAINNARKVSGGTAKEYAAPEQIAEAWANAVAAVQQAVAAHPDLLEAGGLGEGEYPYVKWKGGKRPSVSVAPTRSIATAQTITRAEYDQQVQKHGKQKVDNWLGKKGITVK
jgi:hypothetical protein